MCHFLTSIRVQDNEDVDGGVGCRVSALELYISYILQNGGHRFTSGQRRVITSHFGHFVGALRAFQRLAMREDIFPLSVNGTPYC